MPQPLITTSDLRRYFKMGDSEVHVLRGVDFSVREGEFVAIEGRSGSGKSTLLHILGALDAVDEGRVHFGDVDYTTLTFEARKRLWPRGLALAHTFLTWLPEALSSLAGWIVQWALALGTTAILITSLRKLHDHPIAPLAGKWWMWLILLLIVVFTQSIFLHRLAFVGRLICVACGKVWEWLFYRRVVGNEAMGALLRNRSFGFVFQFYHLLPELTVLENTLIGSMVERSVVGYTLNRGALRTRARQLLNELGLSHRLKHRPAQLSGGERQRVAIARALMNQPRVLFADEPTGNLDAETGAQIMRVLEALHAKGQTIIMVTHDRTIAKRADRAMVLKDGILSDA